MIDCICVAAQPSKFNVQDVLAVIVIVSAISTELESSTHCASSLILPKIGQMYRSGRKLECLPIALVGTVISLCAIPVAAGRLGQPQMARCIPTAQLIKPGLSQVFPRYGCQ